MNVNNSFIERCIEPIGQTRIGHGDEHDDVVTAVAVVLLTGIVSDGHCDSRELDHVMEDVHRRFQLKGRRLYEALARAVRIIATSKDLSAIEKACEIVVQYLNRTQRKTLLDSLALVLLADGVIEDTEVSYFLLIASHLGLLNMQDTREKSH